MFLTRSSTSYKDGIRDLMDERHSEWEMINLATIDHESAFYTWNHDLAIFCQFSKSNAPKTHYLTVAGIIFHVIVHDDFRAPSYRSTLGAG